MRGDHYELVSRRELKRLRIVYECAEAVCAISRSKKNGFDHVLEQLERACEKFRKEKERKSP